MADILHDFPINAPRDRVFLAVSTPSGLDEWWTKRSEGEPAQGSEYRLGFGPEYDWRARLARYSRPATVEFEMVEAMPDWVGSRVGFVLEEDGSRTQVRFYHTGWPAPDGHYRTSSYCWAMYLRVLKRHLEFGETVPYEDRLEV